MFVKECIKKKKKIIERKKKGIPNLAYKQRLLCDLCEKSKEPNKAKLIYKRNDQAKFVKVLEKWGLTF